ncbi:hypothetical protein L210DRAFT_3560948, partial [Boletus edulis BED1]
MVAFLDDPSTQENVTGTQRTGTVPSMAVGVIPVCELFFRVLNVCLAMVLLVPLFAATYMTFIVTFNLSTVVSRSVNCYNPWK